MDTIMEISVYMDNHFSFTVRITMNQRKSILAHFVGWLFHALQTPANQYLPYDQISMKSSNILFRLVLLPTPNFRHTLGSLALNPNTLEQVFEGK